MQTEQILATDHHPINVQVLNIPYLPNNETQIDLEPYCFEVLTHQEIKALTADILSELEKTPILHDDFLSMVKTIDTFRNQWEKIFLKFVRTSFHWGVGLSRYYFVF